MSNWVNVVWATSSQLSVVTVRWQRYSLYRLFQLNAILEQASVGFVWSRVELTLRWSLTLISPRSSRAHIASEPLPSTKSLPQSSPLEHRQHRACTKVDLFFQVCKLAFQIAAKHGHVEVVRLLLDREAEVIEADKVGERERNGEREKKSREREKWRENVSKRADMSLHPSTSCARLHVLPFIGFLYFKRFSSRFIHLQPRVSNARRPALIWKLARLRPWRPRLKIKLYMQQQSMKYHFEIRIRPHHWRLYRRPRFAQVFCWLILHNVFSCAPPRTHSDGSSSSWRLLSYARTPVRVGARRAPGLPDRCHVWPHRGRSAPSRRQACGQ